MIEEARRKRLEGNEIIDGKAHGKKDKKPYTPGPKRLAKFKTKDGEWRADWPDTECVLICRTSECPAEGVEVEARIGENVDGVYRAACGGCGSAIEEIYVDKDYEPIPLEEVDGGKAK